MLHLIRVVIIFISSRTKEKNPLSDQRRLIDAHHYRNHRPCSRIKIQTDAVGAPEKQIIMLFQKCSSSSSSTNTNKFCAFAHTANFKFLLLQRIDVTASALHSSLPTEKNFFSAVLIG